MSLLPMSLLVKAVHNVAAAIEAPPMPAHPSTTPPCACCGRDAVTIACGDYRCNDHRDQVPPWAW